MGLTFSPAKFQGRIRIIKDKKLFIIWGQIKNYPQEKLEAFQSLKKMVPPRAPTLYTDLPYKLDYNHSLHESHYW